MFLPPASLIPSPLRGNDAAKIHGLLEGMHISIAHNIPWVSAFSLAKWPAKSALVCDQHTYEVLGYALSQLLSKEGYEITLIQLGEDVSATDIYVEYILRHCADVDAIIAVGSGTINDLCKYASFLARKPYAICGTAPSMNGYLSANAAITQKGHKKSLKAQLPSLALFDVDVLEAAPKRLIKAGFGDSICRSTAQCDWLLSHLLLGTPYDALPFSLLTPLEPALFSGNVETLIKTLLLSGLGMTYAQGSYPASQGEHLISHYMDMRYADVAETSFHGEHISVTTLFMAALQQQFLQRQTPPQFNRKLFPTKQSILSHFGKETGESVWQEWNRKKEALKDVETLNFKLAAEWKTISQQLMTVCVPINKLTEHMLKLELPIEVFDLGWSKEHIEEATQHAHLIRNRFTFLDMVHFTR